MFTAQQYRAKADEYAALLETARSPAEHVEYRDLHRSFASLADNLEWMSADVVISARSNDAVSASHDPFLSQRE